MFNSRTGIILVIGFFAFILLAACEGGSNNPGSISGKFSGTGGTLMADKAILIIPPNSVTLTDEGLGEQKGDERGRELTTYFTLTESVYEPAFFIEGSVYELQAVSLFEAEITSPLTLKIEYGGFLLPQGFAPTDLVIAYADISTGAVVELESTCNIDKKMIEAPIMGLGIFFLKPRSFSRVFPGYGSTLEYRASSGVNLAGFNPTVPPWNLSSLEIAGTFQIQCKKPLVGMPLIDEYMTAEMVYLYDATMAFENSIWGDTIPALADDAWPSGGVFAYSRQTNEGVEMLIDLLLETEVEGAEGSEVVTGTLSEANYPVLRWDSDGLPTTGNLVSEGVMAVSAGNIFARVYRYDFLTGSPEGWISWTWYGEIDGKVVPVAAIISRNSDADGSMINPLTRCTVYDLATPILF
ncbi:hypothetical protein J7K50_09165 [bacterium]|nr:hypothetical protein [bacterium]